MGITDDDLQIGIPEGGIIRAIFKLDTNIRSYPIWRK